MGGEEQGNMAFYFKGTLEKNSLFLGNKTNVRECLKIILRNKADHKKIFVCCIPSFPPIFPLPNTLSIFGACFLCIVVGGVQNAATIP